MRNSIKSLILLVPVAFLAGCATSPTQVSPSRLAAVHAAAGKPVGSFSVSPTLGSTAIYAWQSLSNDELLVYTRPREAWLLDLTPCPRLFRTPWFTLTSFMGQVDGFSRVRVLRSEIPCQVQQIRPVDVSRLDGKMAHRPGALLVPRHTGAARR